MKTKSMVLGYVATVTGALVALLALACLGQTPPNYVETAVLLIVAGALFGVGWYGLRARSDEITQS